MFVIFWQSQKGRRWISWQKVLWQNTIVNIWLKRKCLSTGFHSSNLKGLISVSSWATSRKNVVCVKRIMTFWGRGANSSTMKNVAWCWQAVKWVRIFFALLRVFNPSGSSIRNQRSKWPQVELLRQFSINLIFGIQFSRMRFFVCKKSKIHIIMPSKIL